MMFNSHNLHVEAAKAPGPEVQSRKRATVALATSLFLLLVFGIIALTSTPSRKTEREESFLFHRNLLFGDKGGVASVCFETTQELYVAVDAYIEDPSATSLVAEKYGYPINDWCVGAITDFYRVFSGVRNLALKEFNEPLNKWDMAKAKTLDRMFERAEKFNQDLDDWETSEVTSMQAVFVAALAFNGKIGSWNTGNVKNMQFIFERTSTFNQDISGWDVSQLPDLINLFQFATAFNQDVSEWNIQSVKGVQTSTFFGASAFNQNLCAWGDHVTPDSNGDLPVFDIMFRETACATAEVNPDLTATPKGPFCFECVSPSAEPEDSEACSTMFCIQSK
jgi:surface protein